MTKQEFKSGYSAYRKSIRRALLRLDSTHLIDAVNDGSIFMRCLLKNDVSVGIRSHCHIRGI